MIRIMIMIIRRRRPNQQGSRALHPTRTVPATQRICHHEFSKLFHSNLYNPLVFYQNRSVIIEIKKTINGKLLLFFKRDTIT